MPTPAPKVSLRSRRVAVVCLSVFTVTVILYFRQRQQVQTINYSQLYALGQAGSAQALQIEGEAVSVTKADGTVVVATVTGEAAQHELVQIFREKNVPVEFRPMQPGPLTTALNWILPIFRM